MQINLDGQVVLVTGAGGGIGAETARLFGESGASVAVADVDVVAASRVADQLRNNGFSALSLAMDVRDQTEIFKGVERVRAWRGQIDVLAHVAGIGGPRAILDIDEQFWQQLVAVNLTGTLFCCQAVLPSMIERRYGRIIAVASTLASLAKRERGAYAATKAGVVALVRDLALEVAHYGITANVVCPGTTDTQMLRKVEPTDAGVRKRGREIPLGRVLEPKDIASAIVYLASTSAAMITGQTLHVNGGQFMP